MRSGMLRRWLSTNKYTSYLLVYIFDIYIRIHEWKYSVCTDITIFILRHKYLTSLMTYKRTPFNVSLNGVNVTDKFNYVIYWYGIHNDTIHTLNIGHMYNFIGNGDIHITNSIIINTLSGMNICTLRHCRRNSITLMY